MSDRAAGWTMTVDRGYFSFVGNKTPFNADTWKDIEHLPLTFKDDAGQVHEDEQAIRFLENKHSAPLTYGQEKSGMTRETIALLAFPKGTDKSVLSALQKYGKPKGWGVERLFTHRDPQTVKKGSEAIDNVLADLQGMIMTASRPLHEIAREIREDWKPVNFAAKPYLEAMEDLDKITDEYGADSAKSIVRYFLSNASQWRGDKAKAIKKELTQMAGIKAGAEEEDAVVASLGQMLNKEAPPTEMTSALPGDGIQGQDKECPCDCDKTAGSHVDPKILKALFNALRKQFLPDAFKRGKVEWDVGHADYSPHRQEVEVEGTILIPAPEMLRALQDTLPEPSDDKEEVMKTLQAYLDEEDLDLENRYFEDSNAIDDVRDQLADFAPMERDFVGTGKFRSLYLSRSPETLGPGGALQVRVLATFGIVALIDEDDLVDPDQESWDEYDRGARAAADDEFLARFEEGKPADPCENLSEADCAEWGKQNEEHKDEFKTATDLKRQAYLMGERGRKKGTLSPSNDRDFMNWLKKMIDVGAISNEIDAPLVVSVTRYLDAYVEGWHHEHVKITDAELSTKFPQLVEELRAKRDLGDEFKTAGCEKLPEGPMRDNCEEKKEEGAKTASMNGYVAFYKGRQIEVEAKTSLEAQQIAARQFKARKPYEVTVVLAEKDGEQVTHMPLFATDENDPGGDKEAAVVDPALKRIVAEYLDFIQARNQAYHQQMGYTLEADSFTLDWGQRYIRIVRAAGGTQRSAYGFIDLTNGDLLKTASWRAPAAHARGNVYDKSTWAKATGPYGLAYLRAASEDEILSTLEQLAEGCPDNLDESECKEWEANTDKYEDKFKTASDSDEKESKFEKGKGVSIEEVTKPMSPEDAKKWKTEHEKNKDQFKTAAHHFDGKYWYGDTAFINQVQHVYPGAELKHLGFGEFVLETPDGKMDFDRSRGQDFPGQSGRSHRLYDDKGGKVVEKAIALMERAHKSEKTAAEDEALAVLTQLAEGCPDNLDESECKEWEANTDKYEDKFKTAGGNTLWSRAGDSGDYNEHGSDLDDAAEALAGQGVIEVSHWIKGGFVGPGFDGHNYVSFFWGDSEGNLERDLTRTEQAKFGRLLADHAGGFSRSATDKEAAPTYQDYVEKKKQKKEKPLDRDAWETKVKGTGEVNQPKRKKNYHPKVKDVMDKHDLEDADADEVRAFKKDKPSSGAKVSPQVLMQRFLSKAKPETKERMKGVSPNEFVKMLGAIMDDESGKTAGCEKLPEGPMRDNCEEKKEEGKEASEDAVILALEQLAEDEDKTAAPQKLMPSALKSKLPAIGSTSEDADPIAWVKYFSPYSGGLWLITEFDGSDEMFGWAELHPGMGELGYISFRELQNAKGMGGRLPLVERDLSFRPKPLSQAKAQERRAAKKAKVSLTISAGTRVTIHANPVSRALYKGGLPAEGTSGTVTPIAFPGGKRTSLPGPGGGLIYVQFDDEDGTFMGVSSIDLIKEVAKHAAEDGVLANLTRLAAKPAKKQVTDWMWVISKDSAGGFIVTIGDPKKPNSKIKARFSGDSAKAELKDWVKDNVPKKVSPNHVVDITGQNLVVPNWEAEFIEALPEKQRQELKLASVDEKEGRYEEGKPADPTENMSEEDAAEWKRMNKEHGDKFKKEAADWTTYIIELLGEPDDPAERKVKRFLQMFNLVNTESTEEGWDFTVEVERAQLDKFKRVVAGLQRDFAITVYDEDYHTIRVATCACGKGADTDGDGDCPACAHKTAIQAPKYEDYVDRKKKDGEQPLSKEDWEKKVLNTGESGQHYTMNKAVTDMFDEGDLKRDSPEELAGTLRRRIKHFDEVGDKAESYFGGSRKKHENALKVIEEHIQSKKGKTASALNLWAAVSKAGALLGATDAEAGRNARYWEKLADSTEYDVVQLSNVPETVATQLIDFSGQPEVRSWNTGAEAWEIAKGYTKQAGCEKLPEGAMRDNCEEKKDEAKDKKAGIASGLYGFTKYVQSDCEAAARKLTKAATRIARKAYLKDERSAEFISTHAKRAGSLPARILVAAFQEMGPKLAAVRKMARLAELRAELGHKTEPKSKTATNKEALARTHGLYGFPVRVASLGMTACHDLHSEAGYITSDLHRRRADHHEQITGFLKAHGKEAKCHYSRLLADVYPEASLRLASQAESGSDWISWE